MSNATRVSVTIGKFASWAGLTSDELIDLLEDYPDLHLHKHRKRVPRYRTLIWADVEKLRDLIPMSKRKELFL